MKVYIAGKITGVEREITLKKFENARAKLTREGHSVLVPTVLPVLEELTQADYLHICFAMIDVCDAVYFLRDWNQSSGAMQELAYAKKHNKKIIFKE